MKFGRIAAGIALAAAALTMAPAVASADDPQFPRNGVIPPGTYHITRHPSNVLGSPMENCDLQVFRDHIVVVLVCGESGVTGRQAPVGPDETRITFDDRPFGLDLQDIDPRFGQWIDIPNIAGTQLKAPYPLAGITLNRR